MIKTFLQNTKNIKYKATVIKNNIRIILENLQVNYNSSLEEIKQEKINRSLEKSHPHLKIGQGCIFKVEGDLQILGPAKFYRFCNVIVPKEAKLILKGDNWFQDFVHIEPNKEIVIGEETTIQRGCQIRADVEIGDYCLFAPNIFISSGTHLYNKYKDLRIRQQDAKFKEENGTYFSDKITIGDDCWLGINTVVTPGVKIGDSVVIGANSVVTKDISSGKVVAGVPAQIIKSRYD